MSEQVNRVEKAQSTQWTAQFLAASELTRRGYTVAITMGNHTPLADLMVGRPDGSLFWVDVKGLSSKSAWLVKPKQPRANLFYILVHVSQMPEAGRVREPDGFFILTQTECNALVESYLAAHPGDSGKAPGFGFKDALPYRDAWGKLIDSK